MARRPGLLTPRRQADVGGIGSFGSGSYSQKSSSPLITVALLIVSAILFVGYTYGNSAFHSSHKKVEQVEKSGVEVDVLELRDPDEKAGDNVSEVDSKSSKISTFADADALFVKKVKTYPVDIVNPWEGDNRETASATSDEEGENTEKKEDTFDGEEAHSGHSAGGRNRGMDVPTPVPVDALFAHSGSGCLEILGSRPLESECQPSLCQAIPLLQDLYGKAMHKILHIGRGSCGIVHELLKEDHIEVWGLEPEEIKTPMDSTCENFIKKGRVRVAEPGHPLPYRPGFFSLILISDALDKLTPSLLRASLKEYARIASRNIIVVVDAKPKRLKSAQGKLLKPRHRAYWVTKFEESGLKIDEEMTQRFENLQQERSFKTNRTFFHLIPGRLVSADR